MYTERRRRTNKVLNNLQKSYFCNAWLCSRGDSRARTKQTLHNEEHQIFCSCFLLLFKEEMTERVKKSSPNSISVFTSKKGILQKNQIKTVNIGTAAKFDFIQGEAGKYFLDFVCKHPSRWTANTPKWPLGEFFLTSIFSASQKKKFKNTCWYIISSYFLCTNLQDIFKKQLIISAIFAFLMDIQKGDKKIIHPVPLLF